VRSDHPRLGFLPEGASEGRTIAGVRDLFREDKWFREYFLPALRIAEERLADQEADAPAAPSEVLLFASAWVATGEDKYAEAALAALLAGEITQTPTAGYYSNVWQFALAYDWLFDCPQMNEERRRAIEERIASALRVELIELDGDYPVIYHGRTQLGNNTLVAALALSSHPDREELLGRAMAHYAEAVRALAMVEGWPEGPGYWIHNRAFPFAVAADCYITATGKSTVAGLELREVLKATALWQLYALAPDGSFVRHGDTWECGPETSRGLWQPPMDYYARITRDPEVIAAADHFRSWQGVQYHPGRYGWSAVLAYEPHLPMPSGYDPARPTEYLNAHLPRARVFGRETLGEAYLLERWGDRDATWISFKAGDVLAHHGHYDQGGFTLTRRSPLAVHSGDYADYTSPYRLGYFLQTVAANSLLVHAPGEFSNFSRQRGDFHEVTGGQRVLMPTGSYVPSLNDWLRNQHSGTHYQAADILAFASEPEAFDYLAADLTEAYNSTRHADPGNPAKVSAVVRKFLYLRQPQAVIIFDRVVTTNADYSTRWLLHTPGRPETESEELIEGPSAEDGRLVTGDRWLRTECEGAQLFHQVLLPEAAQVRKIGGDHYRHYVELSTGGVNLEPGQRRRPESERVGRWRTEVVADEESCEHLFLNVLWPRLMEEEKPSPAVLTPLDASALMVSLGEWAVVLAPREGLNCHLFTYEAPPGSKRHLLVDLRPRSAWRVETAEGSALRFASGDGVLRFDAGGGPVRLTLSAPRNGGGHM